MIALACYFLYHCHPHFMIIIKNSEYDEFSSNKKINRLKQKYYFSQHYCVFYLFDVSMRQYVSSE